MTSYCAIAREHPEHRDFHDKDHGVPVRSDDELFERLLLEINQAGLSWLTVLKKRENFRRAYAGFNVERVANFDASDRVRLLDDAGIIRNRLKVEAAVHNANVILGMRAWHGSFAGWLDAHHPREKAGWVKLFRKTFRFTGGEITNEFLMGVGYLPGAHDPDCPQYERIAAMNPPWLSAW
ncbi:MAG: DNA-3-methyladenine glycosylase I [Gammaproteobacteria bacterium]|nr:DNA-3-methyladenine glycosylase I [Gammaproteobacteria bacterium]